MKRLTFIFIIAMLALSACGGAPSESSPEFAMEKSSYASDSIEMEMPAAAPAMEPMADEMGRSNSAGTSGMPATVERMVIQNADISVVVVDPTAKMESLTRLAEQMGGFVVSSNMYQTYTNNGIKVPEGSITIRVPAEKLDQALEAIKEDAVEVQSENRSGQDVTREYTDLRSRLKNFEAAERQLTQIMDDATDTEQVLATFQQLTYYREQIEVVKGQMQYYEESSSLSAISIRIVAEETIKPIEIGGWKLSITASEAVQDLINYAQGFVQFLIRFIIFTLPVLVTLFIPFYLVFIFVRFLWRKSKVKKTKAEPEAKE